MHHPRNRRIEVRLAEIQFLHSCFVVELLNVAEPDLAAQYGGQLAAYREAVGAVTGVPVLETWLLLPVAGAAVRVSQGNQEASESEPSGVAAPVIAA